MRFHNLSRLAEQLEFADDWRMATQPRVADGWAVEGRVFLWVGSVGSSDR
jgi:hypothetical protein